MDQLESTTGIEEGLSIEAKIGEILLAIGIVLSFIALLYLIFYGNLPFSTRIFPSHFIGRFFSILVLVKCAGIIIASTGFFYAKRCNFQKAGVFAVVATLLPPIDLVLFLAGLLLLISPEARKLS